MAMPTCQQFMFMRHGETDWNVGRRLQGQSDIPLNERGCAQAASAARILKGQTLGRVIASPSLRALKTAAIVAEELNLPICVDGRLKERHFGSLEGLSAVEVRRRHGLDAHETLRRLSFEGVEEWSDLRFRARGAVVDWLNRRPGEPLLFVGHGGFLEALGDSFEIDLGICKHATPYVFRRGGEAWSIEEISVGEQSRARLHQRAPIDGA